MAATVTPPKEKTREPSKEAHDGRGRPPEPPGGGNGGNGDPQGPDPRSMAVQRYRLGMWIAIGGIVMLFAAFTSAMVVRKGLGNDWSPFELPVVLWASTAALLASSFTLEAARRAMWRGVEEKLRRWIGITAGLGAVFLGCQLLAWNELASRGLYVASTPNSSFFYLLTATHGLHLAGGVLAMGYTVLRVWRNRPWITREATVEATTLYWHFMDGLWVYLFVLLMVWR